MKKKITKRFLLEMRFDSSSCLVLNEDLVLVVVMVTLKSKWNKKEVWHPKSVKLTSQAKSIKRQIISLGYTREKKLHKDWIMIVFRSDLPAVESEMQSMSFSLHFSLWFLWVPGSRLCFTKRTNGSISMNGLMARQTVFHGRRLLSEGCCCNC